MNTNTVFKVGKEVFALGRMGQVLVSAEKFRPMGYWDLVRAFKRLSMNQEDEFIRLNHAVPDAKQYLNGFFKRHTMAIATMFKRWFGFFNEHIFTIRKSLPHTETKIAEGFRTGSLNDVIEELKGDPPIVPSTNRTYSSGYSGSGWRSSDYSYTSGRSGTSSTTASRMRRRNRLQDTSPAASFRPRPNRRFGFSFTNTSPPPLGRTPKTRWFSGLNKGFSAVKDGVKNRVGAQSTTWKNAWSSSSHESEATKAASEPKPRRWGRFRSSPSSDEPAKSSASGREAGWLSRAIAQRAKDLGGRLRGAFKRKRGEETAATSSVKTPEPKVTPSSEVTGDRGHVAETSPTPLPNDKPQVPAPEVTPSSEGIRDSAHGAETDSPSPPHDKPSAEALSSETRQRGGASTDPSVSEPVKPAAEGAKKSKRGWLWRAAAASAFALPLAGDTVKNGVNKEFPTVASTIKSVLKDITAPPRIIPTATPTIEAVAKTWANDQDFQKALKFTLSQEGLLAPDKGGASFKGIRLDIYKNRLVEADSALNADLELSDEAWKNVLDNLKKNKLTVSKQDLIAIFNYVKKDNEKLLGKDFENILKTYFTDEKVGDYYYHYYWIPSGADQIAQCDAKIVYFDNVVNAGVDIARNNLQLAQDPGMVYSGNPNKSLLEKLLDIRADKYRYFANNHIDEHGQKTQLPNLPGWLNRLSALKDYVAKECNVSK